jgi:hypothetical protein
MLRRNLCSTDAMPFETRLIDEPACSNAFDLLEDRSTRGERFDRGLPLGPPPQILSGLIEDCRSGSGGKLERDVEDDDLLVVQAAVIIAKLEERGVDNVPCVATIKDLRGLNHFLDEQRSKPVRGEKMQILPDRPSHTTGYASEMLESGEFGIRRRGNQVSYGCTALRREPRALKTDVIGVVVNDEATESPIPNQDIRAGAQQEPGDPRSTSLDHCQGKRFLVMDVDEEVSRAADPVCRQRRQRHVITQIRDRKLGGGHRVRESPDKERSMVRRAVYSVSSAAAEVAAENYSNVLHSVRPADTLAHVMAADIGN